MAPVRALFTFNNVLHAVRGESLIRLDSNGEVETLGTLNSAGGAVDMEQNLTQLCLTDSNFLYVWDGTTLETVPNWTTGDRIAFVDQRIVGTQTGTQKFGWTALGDAKSVAFLDFASAEGVPDKLVSVLASQRELLLLGETSAEVWYSVGGSTVFERAQSEYIQYGCAAAFSAQICGDTPVWLGRDKDGQAQVLAGRGQRISTRAIEERFEGLDLGQARAFSYSDGGHRFYCLNVPRVDTTLVFDLTFKAWHERAELVNGSYRQWRPRCHAFAYGKHYFGANDGSIYELDSTASNINGDVLCRDRVMPVISQASRRRVRFPSLEVICEKASAKKVLLRWSDDNGFTWSNWHEGSTGATGNYAAHVRWNRLGSAFDRVYHIRMTDDAKFNPVSINAEVK